VDTRSDDLGNLLVSPAPGYGTGFDFGYVTTAALTQVPVRPVTYQEQTTNAQRSFSSNSANDTAAGTGARTVEITYFDQNMAGPYTETITMNGTSWVNTTATNICFIQHVVVKTAGSGGTNAGILTLRSTTGGGGNTIMTVQAGDSQWISAHHYIAAGKNLFISGINASHNGTTVGSGGLFVMKYLPLGGSVELQVSDFVRLYGQSSTFSRVYQSPIRVAGPGRVTLYVSPESTSTLTYRGGFDYYEQ
jgi:hypothetical protein